MSFKEATDTAAGDATRYSAPDIKKIAQYLNGSTDIATAVIDSSTTIQNGKLHVASITNTGTITLPTATTTLVGRDTTDTLTGKSISGSDNTITNIADAALSSNVVMLTGTQVLANKELTDPKITNGNTGAGTADLSNNCPAVDPSIPYTWLKMKSSDGSVVYVPAFK